MIDVEGGKVYDLAVEWMEELKPTKESDVTNDTETTN